jgi:hypothetical protein
MAPLTPTQFAVGIVIGLVLAAIIIDYRHKQRDGTLSYGGTYIDAPDEPGGDFVGTPDCKPPNCFEAPAFPPAR